MLICNAFHVLSFQWRWRPGKSRQLAQLEATMILLAIVTPPLLCGIILCSQKIADYFKEPGHAWKMAGMFLTVRVYNIDGNASNPRIMTFDENGIFTDIYF